MNAQKPVAVADRSYPNIIAPQDGHTSLGCALGLWLAATWGLLILLSCVFFSGNFSWIGLCIALIIAGIWALRRYYVSQTVVRPRVAHFIQAAARAEARVLDRKMETTTDPEGGTTTRYTVTYEFMSADVTGQSLSMTLVESGQALYQATIVGQTLIVCYLPENPRMCMAESTFHRIEPQLRKLAGLAPQL